MSSGRLAGRAGGEGGESRGKRIMSKLLVFADCHAGRVVNRRGQQLPINHRNDDLLMQKQVLVAYSIGSKRLADSNRQTLKSAPSSFFSLSTSFSSAPQYAAQTINPNLDLVTPPEDQLRHDGPLRRAQIHVQMRPSLRSVRASSDNV
jgi:hypothetical protein